MNLNSIEPSHILELKNVASVFPMCTSEYLNTEAKGDIYFTDKFEWFTVTDDTYEYEAAKKSILGLVCTTDDRWLKNSFHISVLEVASPVKGLGIGTEIMDYLIDTAIKVGYDAITLQLHEPSLSKFYTKFGFKPVDFEGTEIYVLKI